MNRIEQIKGLTNKFEQNLKYYQDTNKHYNEHSCRIEYIDPFLRLLGWDVSNEKALAPQYREVIAENYSTETDRPDYSLTLKGVTKFFVEAKKPAVDINKLSEPAFQTRKYGWNANHKIAVLTNFEYLIIYDTTYVPEINDNCSVALYRKYHYSEYLSKFEEIESLLSRDNVYNGNFDNFFLNTTICSERYKKQVDDLFLEQINNWRLSLSNYLYSTSEKYCSIGKLNDVVQEFINQIVFLRICEDRNLSLYHKLKDTINDEQVKTKLGELFRLADKRYNSGMFDGENIIFDLNNEIIINIIVSLYYPQSPYLFNIIEPNILGKIYEAFLTEQLAISDDDKIILKKKKDCVNRAIVTTPIEIVKYMVEKTLGRLCLGKTPKEIEKLKIADIACGSGIFLEEVYNYLIQYCVDWYKLNKPDYLIELDSGRRKLPLEDKKKILYSCIFGIDIDIHAVEVAKFSLLIKLIEDETNPSVEGSLPILPNLDNNILYGNSLISSEDLTNRDVSNEELLEIAPFDWESINEGKCFDAIVGNPPYVNTENMHDLLTEIEFNLYKLKYKTSYKQFDKYFIFTERAIQKTAVGGYICYIIPNKFFKIGAGKKLRKLISENKFLISLDDFGDSQLFADKTIYSSIVLLQKSSYDEFVYARVKSPVALWSGEENDAVTLNSSILNEHPWRLTTDIDFLNVLKKLDNVAVSINKYVDIFGGIQTSAETKKTYWFSSKEILREDKNTFTISRNDKVYHIEKNILKPYFKPVKRIEKGLNTYSILKTDKWIIFPYDACGKLLSKDIMEEEFSGAYEYLLDNYDDLVPKGVAPQGKRKIPNATADTWYQYGRNQHLSSFSNRIKLIVGIMSKFPMYAYDSEDMLISVGGTAGYCAITIKENSPYELEYIQAWLTSPYTERILQVIGSDFENGFYARGGDVLKTLPFVDLDFNNPKHKKIYNDVVKETREIYKINKQLAENPERSIITTLERKKIKLIRSIEENVNRVYRLEF